MKKYLLVLLVVVGTFGVSHAVQAVTYNETVVNGYVTSDTEYPVDLMVNNVDNLSMQVTYSTATFTPIKCSTAAINDTLDVFTSTQAYPAGFAVIFTSSALYNIGLTNNATYYAVPAGTGYISLATTKANAIAGTVINISSKPVSGSFTLTPVGVVDATPFGFRWQVSNDNVNWFSLATSSVSLLSTTAAATTIWDFGVTTYRYIRCHFVSSAFGAVSLKIVGYGKR